ncbi:MAG: peptidase [Gemmatimonadetes bacterium]|nr:peptidase [Gemmatimonadota bacterium]
MSDAAAAVAAGPGACAGCGTELGPGRLSCPGCGRLLHADELRRLAAEAAAQEAAGEIGDALGTWREALLLLPADSGQHAGIRARIEELVKRGGASVKRKGKAKSDGRNAATTGIGATVLAFLLKFKTALFLLLGKGKLLLLGLTKAGTILSMMVWVGVYWRAFGWPFAVGVVAALYVHEMGHVWELRRRGMKAEAPMFIPGLGAFVMLRHHPVSPTEDARIGLAGPIWGLGATVACFGLYLATGAKVLYAVGEASAWLNLFNLLPVWQLDGGRAFNALTRPQRWMAVAALAAFYVATRDRMLVIVLIGAVARGFMKAPDRPDWRALATYAALAGALAFLLPSETGWIGR